MDKPTIAILSRTNLGLRIFEQALSDAGVKYHLVGKSGYWASPEVRISLAFLGCCLYPADYLLAQAIRAPFDCAKFLPKAALLAELKARKDEEMSYWKLLVTEPDHLVPLKNRDALCGFTSFILMLSRYKNLPAGDALKSVLSVLKAVEYYHNEESVDNDPIANLSELVKIAGRFPDIKSFLDYSRRVTAASKSKKGVGLSTIHSFKGAEADTIYLVGCQEGQMPHAKATDLSEERNIFFVGCSRPRHQLIITHAGPASPFLKDFLDKQKQPVV
jgi:DNA helicase-2/ATP-dependent DNA helicase PcrA